MANALSRSDFHGGLAILAICSEVISTAPSPNQQALAKPADAPAIDRNVCQFIISPSPLRRGLFY